MRIGTPKTRTLSPSIVRWCILIAGCLLISCLVSPRKATEHFETSSADSAIAGYHVRSYFHGGVGKEWKSVYRSGSLLDDSENFYDPPASMKITGTDTPSNIIEKVLDPPENVCGDVFVSVKLLGGNQANLSAISLMSISLIGGKTYADSANYSFHQPVKDSLLTDPGRWTRVNMAMRTFSSSPTFNCHDVERVRIRLSAQPGTDDTVSLGELAFYPSPLAQAALIITEDDQWADFDTNGLPAMRKYGFPGTVYANCGLLGVANKMTMERLKTLQDSGGWTIASHLWSHDTITNLTDDSAAASLRQNAEFLQANGFKGYRHFAYPYGIMNRAKDSVVRRYAETARLVVGWQEGEGLPYPDLHRLRVLGFLERRVTLEMAKSAIDQLVANKTAGILGVHEIVLDGDLDTRKWYRPDWEAMMDYVGTLVRQGKLKVYALDDYMRMVSAFNRPQPARASP